MVNTDILSIYYGGVIVFIKDVTVMTSDKQVMNYRKGQELHITPAILHMVGAGVIPRDCIKPILRKLDQLEDSEVIELSYIVAPVEAKNGLIGLNRKVFRQGERKGYTIEVSLGKVGVVEKSMVINSAYDIAVSEIVYPPFDGRPIITQTASRNQVKAHRWMVQKHLDVFGLISKRHAVGRKNWSSEGYETPNSPRFK